MEHTSARSCLVVFRPLTRPTTVATCARPHGDMICVVGCLCWFVLPFKIGWTHQLGTRVQIHVNKLNTFFTRNLLDTFKFLFDWVFLFGCLLFFFSNDTQTMFGCRNIGHKFTVASLIAGLIKFLIPIFLFRFWLLFVLLIGYSSLDYMNCIHICSFLTLRKVNFDKVKI